MWEPLGRVKWSKNYNNNNRKQRRNEPWLPESESTKRRWKDTRNHIHDSKTLILEPLDIQNVLLFFLFSVFVTPFVLFCSFHPFFVCLSFYFFLGEWEWNICLLSCLSWVLHTHFKTYNNNNRRSEWSEGKAMQVCIILYTIYSVAVQYRVNWG